MTDGDTVFTLATGDIDLPAHANEATRVAAINQILRAGADVFSAACTHAVLERDDDR